MKSLRLALKLLARDWKSGELAVLSPALVLAVTALTAVAFLTDRVGHAVELRAAESLAADLRLSSPNPLPDAYRELARKSGLDSAEVISMPSVVFAGDANTLAAVRAVSPGYPLRGRLKTAPRLLAPGLATDTVPGSGEAWAAPRLLARLGVDVPVTIEVGRSRFEVTQVLDFRPDQGWNFVDLAPTLLINSKDLDATGLVQPGSRVRYRMLFAGGRDDVNEFKSTLAEQLADSEMLRDIQDTNPQIRSAMDRSGRFLNLASLVSVLLAAFLAAVPVLRRAGGGRRGHGCPALFTPAPRPDRAVQVPGFPAGVHPHNQPAATPDAGPVRRHRGHRAGLRLAIGAGLAVA